MCWVTSLFTAISFFTVLMIYMPRSTEFLLGAYRVYEAMVIGRFVELNLLWHGGEKELMRGLGENPRMRFNLPPCCCCLLCMKNSLVTRDRVKMVRCGITFLMSLLAIHICIYRLVVGQMVYIQLFVLFLQLVFQFNDIHDGPLSLSNPHTYVKFAGRISFLFGFWGLFVFFKVSTCLLSMATNLTHVLLKIEHTFKLLEGFRYVQKFTVMKLILVLFLVQETIIEGLASRGIISCIPHLSGLARGSIINCCMVMVEAFILGVVNFYLYNRFVCVVI